MEGTRQTVVIVAGAQRAQRGLGGQLLLFQQLCDESGGGGDTGGDLAAPLRVLLGHDLGVVAVQNHNGKTRFVQRLGAHFGLLTDFLGVAHQVAQHHAGGRLIGKNLGGNARLCQQRQQMLRHFRNLDGGDFADVHQNVSAVLTVGGLLHTVDVAGGLHVFDQIHDALRSDLADHGFGAGFPDEQRRLIAGGAVIGAGVAQQALVHGLTHILVKLLCLLVDHAQQQALGAGGVQFLTGLVLDRAQMAAHPAEAALFRMMQGILTNHIVTSYPFLTDPACRGS